MLLHDGFGTIGMLKQLLQQLAETRQVIAMELRGHGHTADIERPLSYEFMAVTVNGNWRLTFKFEDGDAVLVDYQDWHWDK